MTNVMTDEELQLTIADYEDSITKLEVYIKKEPNQAKCDEATKTIDKYLDKMSELDLLRIIGRTAALNDLVDELRVITNNASKTPQLSDAVKKLREATDKAAMLAGGSERSAHGSAPSPRCGTTPSVAPSASRTRWASGGGIRVAISAIG